MSFRKTLSIIVFLLIGKVSTVSKACDYYEALKPNVIYTIASPKYPQKYLHDTDCRWAAEAPPGYKISLNCDEVRLPSVFLCGDRVDRILVSTSGEANFSDASRRCGGGAFTEKSLSTRMTIALKTGPFIRGGKFKCSLKAVANICSCGQLNRKRIIGGTETQINEYPSMAVLVSFEEHKVLCGATIISVFYALSAALCQPPLGTRFFGLLIGEHDITKGTETPYSSVVNIAAFTKHPNFTFNETSIVNNIALIKTSSPMPFSYGVQPACLPFKYRGQTFVNKVVQATGWGTTSFAGQGSNVLQQVSLSIVSNGNCTPNEICSFAKDKDTCQSDLGGPLFYIDKNIVFLVGIVSHGYGCATKKPTINVRITSYLDWIVQNTGFTQFCER